MSFYFSENADAQKEKERGKISPDIMETASKIAMKNPDSHISLHCRDTYRNLRKGTNAKLENRKHPTLLALVTSNRVVFLTAEQESQLCEYLKRSSQIMFGLTSKEARKLAYECGVSFGVNVPDSWKSNKSAAQPTSSARRTSFNKTNVSQFHEKLSDVLSDDKIPPSRIFNVDETGLSTVMNPSLIIVTKGMKQLGCITSAERGEMITETTAIRTIGNALPSIFIFPRKKFRDHFVRETASKSGWQTEEIFLTFIKQFIEYTSPSLINTALLLLVNHSSHISCPVLGLCKASGVIRLSFPPHCSHRLQPLDVSLISLLDFQNTLSPLNVHTFSNDDFASAFVTDRPLPRGGPKILQNDEVSVCEETVENNVNGLDECVPNAHVHNGQEVNEILHQQSEEQRRPLNLNNISVPSTSGFSPEIVHPFPKAPKGNQNPRTRLKR
ncbi:hypothetical protein PR048_002866 [Dryococelus australis]|uniref:DDE-1 domain-containing protein n=1 Tax=Dryococelus australis TaxID=614101 RepID=A0ABQ9IMT5_9NEOP|nr:hypothetical protein PR048_002866 [Dryococelus australis]